MTPYGTPLAAVRVLPRGLNVLRTMRTSTRPLVTLPRSGNAIDRSEPLDLLYARLVLFFGPNAREQELRKSTPRSRAGRNPVSFLALCLAWEKFCLAHDLKRDETLFQVAS